MSSSALSAQQTPYVDPALRALVQTSTPENAAVSMGVALRRRTAVDAARIGIFARVRDESAVAVISSVGGTVGTRIGRLLTAEIPLTAVPALTQSTAFEIIEASRTVALTNDSSMKAIRADVVRQQIGGNWTGSAGQGVIVGIYDTGIDYLHEDFITPNRETRVLALWDQTAAVGPPPAGFAFGRLCTREDIQQAINTNETSSCPQTDSNGHGTHVAGSAAGDGSAGGAYAGVAPLADLMIVKGGNGSFSESNIMDGLRWLERQARALNRPMVVNLSLGGQFGAHDGTRIYEMLLDSVSRPGFIVVVAAVNDGSNGNDKNPDGTEPVRNPLLIHGSGQPGATVDHTFEILQYTSQPGICNEFINFSLFYEAQDRLDISVVRPDGSIVTATFGQVVDRESLLGNVRIDNVQSRTPNPSNGAFEADIRVNDCGVTGAAPAVGTWTLRVATVTAGSGKRYHYWMYAQILGGGAFARGRTNFDNRYVVGSPGTARSAITVGAFATRLCWPSPAKPEGPVCFVTREPIGDIARFSSPGPTRDGRMKPEITAPGMAVASALSRSSSPAANRILPDGVHVINQGTSMAAPHVTGAIAAMLQHQPSLDATTIRGIFAVTAERDAFTSRVYALSPEGQSSDWWGYGKLNVCGAIGALGGGGATAGTVVITPATDTLPVNATARFFTCSPTSASVTFASTNPDVATVDAGGVVRALRTGNALIIAASGAFADTATVVVTAPGQLAITARSASPSGMTLGKRGTVLPLLSVVMRSTGYEAQQIRTLGFRVSGRDANAHLLLVADNDRDGAYDAGERILERQPIALNGEAMDVDVTIDSLTIPQRDSLHIITAIELSGAAPNLAVFAAELLPQRSHTLGVRSQAT
ncbi:MAG TPA: S8 family serine peptidase, partial [Longimicrobiales bacterium]